MNELFFDVRVFGYTIKNICNPKIPKVEAAMDM